MNKFQNKYITIWEEGEIAFGLYEEVDVDLIIANEIVKQRLLRLGPTAYFLLKRKAGFLLRKRLEIILVVRKVVLE